MINLIGIHGPLNSGKDTVALIIQKRLHMHNQYFKTYAFAKPIKDACKAMFGFTQEQLEDRVLKETLDPFWGFTPRRAMQLLGTEYGRELMRPDVWIKRAKLEHNFNTSTNTYSGTIITDVRFQNEVDWVMDQPHAILIYIESPNIVRDERYSHESEAGISRDDRFHYVHNDKMLGLAHLEETINTLLKTLNFY